ncbi:type I restriction-modification system DNA methylase subunit [Lewinella aquimaris]|uniref:site-specific DNA-methyltransferase (adenine-specific) n=1 Tax=Neolewinella aquimaris TaxID=1835722 RepID=A0A840EAY9_9BACT|nr:N-6 DNA methylase [Neolewinella aquimaris]MBB4081103.1 type I restriction-modification system DNA methylase subunit [Neolewinella aquimaris]
MEMNIDLLIDHLPMKIWDAKKIGDQFSIEMIEDLIANDSNFQRIIISGYDLIDTQKPSWRDYKVQYYEIISILNNSFSYFDSHTATIIIQSIIRLSHDENNSKYVDVEFDFQYIIGSIFNSNNITIDKNLSSELVRTATSIINQATSTLSKNDKKRLNQVLSYAKLESSMYPLKEFAFYFSYQLRQIESKKSNLHTTPSKISKIVTELAAYTNSNPNSIINPVIGIGAVTLDLVSLFYNDRIQVYGNDLNGLALLLAYLNIKLQKIDYAKLENTDIFQVEEYGDIIIADLPLSMRKSYQRFAQDALYAHGLKVPNKFSELSMMILHCLKLKNIGGVALLIVPNSILQQSGALSKFRNYLIKNHNLRAVVQLPKSKSRSYDSSLLIFDDKHNEDKLRFINGEILDRETGSGKYNLVDIVDSLITVNDDLYPEFMSEVNYSELNSGFQLIYKQYSYEVLSIQKILEDEEGYTLGELFTLRSGKYIKQSEYLLSSNTQNSKVPYVKIENLSENVLDRNLDLSGVVYVSPNDLTSSSFVTTTSILIAKIGDSIKPTIFNPSMEVPAIAIHNNVVSLTPKSEGLYNLEYIYYQLYDDVVNVQIDASRSGGAFKTLSLTTLRRIIIPLPSLEQQLSQINTARASIVASEQRKVSERIAAAGFKDQAREAQRNIVKTLIHQLRPNLMSINMKAEGIRDIVAEHKIGKYKRFSEDVMRQIDSVEGASPIENLSLEQYINNLTDSTQHLNNVLSNVDKVMNLELKDLQLETVEIKSFIEDVMSTSHVIEENNIKYNVKGEEFEITISRTSFRELIEQLIINASQHAFDVTRNKRRQISFSIKGIEQNEYIEIAYTNNGKPFKLKPNEFLEPFTKGSNSNGSGIGGNYIERIVSLHDGKMHIRNDTNKPILITFIFPVK